MKKSPTILIIKLQALGDILLASPLFSILHNCFPDAQIDHMVLDQYRAVTLSNPAVTSQIVMHFRKNDRWSHRIHNIGELIKCCALRSHHYDYVLNLHPGFQGRLIAALVGGKLTIHAPRTMITIQQHFLVQFLDEIKKHISAVEYTKDDLPLNYTININNVRDDIVALKSTQYCCIHPGGGNNWAAETTIKRWPTERISNLITLLHTAYPDLAIVVTGDTGDRAVVTELCRRFPFLNDYCEKTNLDELAFLFATSKLVITPDTAALHLAAAVSATVIALFGPTSPEQLMPFNNAVKLIRTRLQCAPCYFGIFTGCRTGKADCMTSISAEDVFSVVTMELEKTDV